jgi:hypothetical protein
MAHGHCLHVVRLVTGVAHGAGSCATAGASLGARRCAGPSAARNQARRRSAHCLLATRVRLYLEARACMQHAWQRAITWVVVNMRPGACQGFVVNGRQSGGSAHVQVKSKPHAASPPLPIACRKQVLQRLSPAAAKPCRGGAGLLPHRDVRVQGRQGQRVQPGAGAAVRLGGARDLGARVAAGRGRDRRRRRRRRQPLCDQRAQGCARGLVRPGAAGAGRRRRLCLSKRARGHACERL